MRAREFEGEYSGAGRRLDAGTPRESAEQTSVFTRRGIERVVRYAFESASRRPRKLLASATKSNALQHSMVLWDEVVAEVAVGYPDVTVASYHVDALAARMVSHPESLDVIVASNLFGDILTDLGAAVSGSLGMGASANLNPEREHPSMFEPIHGSAPDIAGRGVANPVGAIWAGAMMLEHLGENDAASRVMAAIEKVLAAGAVRTPDLGEPRPLRRWPALSSRDSRRHNDRTTPQLHRRWMATLRYRRSPRRRQPRDRRNSGPGAADAGVRGPTPRSSALRRRFETGGARR